MGIKGDRVRFKVGGKRFETTATTLANAGPRSYFAPLFDENWDLQATLGDEVFIDRNPVCFGILLDLLRTGELYNPRNVPEDLLYREALFYGILDNVRAAKWGAFDGRKRPQLAHTIKGRAIGGGKMIRASEEGAFCVASEYHSTVYVYDWLLQEHPEINLPDKQKLNDIGWADARNIVITTSKGMSLFNSSTGELKQRFGPDDLSNCRQVQTKGFNAGCLCFDRDRHRIFSIWKGMDNEKGVAIWDQETGKQIDFIHKPGDEALGDAHKMQWLNNSSCLFVAIPHGQWRPKEETRKYSLRLFDIRDKRMAWSWSVPQELIGNYDEKDIQNAVAMEERSSICLTDSRGGLYYMDLRNHQDVQYGPEGYQNRLEMISKHLIRPKLEYYEGQLLVSMNSFVAVFSGDKLKTKLELPRSDKAYVRDFSIGGNRLVTLGQDYKDIVVDVWQNPRPHLL